MTNAAPSRPTATTFHQSVVYLLGKLSGWKAYVSVPAEDVLDDALRLAGIDPETTDWQLEGREGLYRRVGWAVRNQCRTHCGKRPAHTTIFDKNEWAVTALGLVEAKQLKAKFEGQIQLSSGPNLTAKWIDENYRALYERLHSYLGRKLPVSAQRSKVEDHIHTFFTNLINRDGLRSRIEEGQSIPYSQVCAWAKRSSISEFRDEGTEPVCRVNDGALTKKEQGDFDPSNWTVQVIPRSINQSEQLGVNTYAEHDFDQSPAETMDFLADETDVEAEVLDVDAFHEALKAVGAALQAEISADKDWEWHAQLVRDRFIDGMTVKEIAEKYDIDRNKATVALGRIRKAVGRHREALEAEFLTR
jgi:hypothetical protein